MNDLKKDAIADNEIQIVYEPRNLTKSLRQIIESMTPNSFVDVLQKRIAELEAERDALKAALSEGVLASHDGKVPNRQWAAVQSWLYPGDKIVLVCGDAAIAAKGE